MRKNDRSHHKWYLILKWCAMRVCVAIARLEMVPHFKMIPHPTLFQPRVPSSSVSKKGGQGALSRKCWLPVEVSRRHGVDGATHCHLVVCVAAHPVFGCAVCTQWRYYTLSLVVLWTTQLVVRCFTPNAFLSNLRVRPCSIKCFSLTNVIMTMRRCVDETNEANCRALPTPTANRPEESAPDIFDFIQIAIWLNSLI